MSEIDAETHAKMRRSIGEEVCRAEDDFDETRNLRKEIVDRLAQASRSVLILDDKGNTREDTDTAVRLMNAALKGLSDIEKSGATMIGIKQRQNEAAALSAAATRERLEIVIRATAAGRIEDSIEDLNLEGHLDEMFSGEIKDFELKTSAKDLSD